MLSQADRVVAGHALRRCMRVVMSATIHELPAARHPSRTADTALPTSTPDLSERFMFWRGASGAAYVHTVYSLIGCPEVPPANFVLVRRSADGERRVLKIGRVTDAAPSVNLAELRHVGANLGANEVHVHLLAGHGLQSRRVELDIRAAAMPEPVRYNIPPARHLHH
jgi:hypothetical protein